MLIFPIKKMIWYYTLDIQIPLEEVFFFVRLVLGVPNIFSGGVWMVKDGYCFSPQVTMEVFGLHVLFQAQLTGRVEKDSW